MNNLFQWQKQGDMIKKQGEELLKLIVAASKTKRSTLPELKIVLNTCFEHYQGAFDEENKGFGGAPKFPRPGQFKRRFGC